MSRQFKFSNLLGTVYHKGDLVFSNDGNSIYAPVGNKITCYDLHRNTSFTLPLEVKGNFTAMTLSPSGTVMLAATDRNSLHMISIQRRRILYSKTYQAPIRCIQFSPDGRYFAFSQKNYVRICKCTGLEKRVFNPFCTEKNIDASTAEVTCISWSFDSRLVAFGSNDMLVRVVPVKHMDLGKQIATIGGQSQPIQGIFFDQSCYNLYSVCRSSKVMYFNCSLTPDELNEKSLEESRRDNKNLIKKENGRNGEVHQNEKNWLDFTCTNSKFITDLLKTKSDKEESNTATLDKYTNPEVIHRESYVQVISSYFHKLAQVLVVACNTGDFAVMDSSLDVLHSYNVSKQPISSISMNLSGDWVALGVSSLGQLLVWELKSETYVLKQQGHNKSMNVVCYSPDGSCLASGGDDGKVKIWSTVSSFCYVTFSEHTASVTGLAFTQSGRAILSSSLDGTVRAYDLVRYRNFKTLTSPESNQFTCLAVDSSGELIAAGGQDIHDIYLWSLKLGSLLEILPGHTGPVRSLCFSPIPGSTMLASTAWDQTVKVWDSINTTQAKESVRLLTDGLCVKIRPDGKQLAVSTMGGKIYFFNSVTAAEEGCIEGRHDLGLSRKMTDEITAEKNQESKFFDTLCYSPDGQQVIAGGPSQYICIYNVPQQLLVRKLTITQNRTFDGMLEVYNKKKHAKKGINLHQIERRPDLNEPDIGQKSSIKLPGVQRGDMSQRQITEEIRISDVNFAFTGRSFVVCCTEGLLIYSLDSDWLFDPLDAQITNTPSAIKRKLDQEEWALALMMAIRLNVTSITQMAVETIPMDSVPVVVQNLPVRYIEQIIVFIAQRIEKTKHLGVYMRWARLILYTHGVYLKGRAPQIVTALNDLYRACSLHYSTLSKLCTKNKHMLEYLRRQSDVRKEIDGFKVKEEDTELAVSTLEKVDANSNSDSDDFFGSESENVSSDSDVEMLENI